MGCGKLQINRFHLVVFFAWQLSTYFSISQQLFPIFSNYSPRFRCVEDNETTQFGKNCAALAACAPEAVELENAAFYSTVLEFDLVCGPRSYIPSMISSMQFLGVLLGTISFGHLADKFGRKPISLICIALGVIFVMLSGWLFYGCRILCPQNIHFLPTKMH
jgi:MFS family permease